MVDYTDVENIIELLDSRMGAGTSRINLHVEDSVANGQVREVSHHGRCDVGSVWANGTAGNMQDTDDYRCS